jgi:hypothetical protein
MKRITNNRWNLFLFVVLFATFSCNHEEVGPDIPTIDSEGNPQEVTIKINVPFEESNQLRSIGHTEEDSIHTIDILAFRVEGENAYFDYFVEGKKGTGNTITAVLWTRPYQQRLVIITNARDKVEQLSQSADPIGWRGTEKNAMLEGLEFSLTEGVTWKAIDASNYTAFPMWGESGAVTITKQPGQFQLQGSISLLRMVAKIDVQLDETVPGLTDKFKMKSVRLYNTHTKGSIVPKETRNGIVTKATVPAGAEKQLGPLVYKDFTASEEAAFCGSIYTFETAAAAAGETSKATCLVVGGHYNNENKETYYRIDFLDDEKEFIDILRNHHYTVNITNVTGSGYGTWEEAFEAKSVNMSVNILVWDEGGMYDVVFDGQFFLSVSKDEFNFSRSSYTGRKTNNVLTILTNYKTSSGISGWHAEVNAEWLRLVDNEGEPDVKKEIIMEMDANDTGSDRTAIITFAAGRLRYPVTVTQTTRELPSINFFEKNPGDNGAPIDTLKFYHKETTGTAESKKFTVRWTPANSDLIVYEAPVQEDLLPLKSIVPELRVVSNQPGYYSFLIDIAYNADDIGKATSLVFLVSNEVEVAEKRLVIYYYPEKE